MTSRVLLPLLLHLVNCQDADLDKRESGPLHFVPLNQDLLANTPQMNYGQWIPIQQNPMRDDPTFEYLPPSLHTVYFGEGSPTSHPVRPVHPIPAAQVIQDDLNPLSPQFFNLRPPPPPLSQEDKPTLSQPQEVISTPGNEVISPPGHEVISPSGHEEVGGLGLTQVEGENQDTDSSNEHSPPSVSGPKPLQLEVIDSEEMLVSDAEVKLSTPNSVWTTVKPKPDLTKLRFRPGSRPSNSKFNIKFPPSILSRPPFKPSSTKATPSTTTTTPVPVESEEIENQTDPTEPSEGDLLTENTHQDGWVGMVFYNSHSRPPKPSDNNKENEIPLLSRPLETMTIESPTTEYDLEGEEAESLSETTSVPEREQPAGSHEDKGNDFSSLTDPENNPIPASGPFSFFDRVSNLFKDVVKETYKQPESQAEVVSEEDPKLESVNESPPEDNNLEEYKAIEEDQDFPQDDRERDHYMDKSGEEDSRTGERDYFTVTKKDTEQPSGYLPPGNNELLLGDPEGEVAPLEETDERELYNGSDSAEEITLPSSDKETEQRHNQLQANKPKLKLVVGDRSEEYPPSTPTTTRYDLELTKSKIESHKHKNILSVNHRSTTTFVPKIRPFRPSRRPLSPALQSLVSKSSPSTPRFTSTPSPSIMKFQKKKKGTTPRPIRNQPLVIIQGHSNVKLYGINAPKTKKPLINYPTTRPSFSNSESTTQGLSNDPFSESDLLLTGSSFSEPSFPLHPHQFGESLELGSNKPSNFLNTVSSMLTQFFNTPKPLSKTKLKLVNRPVRQEASTEGSFVVMSVFDKKEHPSVPLADDSIFHSSTHDDNEGHLDKSLDDWLAQTGARDHLAP